MRDKVSVFLGLAKQPTTKIAAKKPKSQLSWSKGYQRWDFRVNSFEPENNKKPNEPGFKREETLTQTGLDGDTFEPVEEEPKLEVFEPEEDEPKDDWEMKFVAG